MDADEIGAIGEDEFNAWCSKAGITAVRATRDRHGWDYILTFTAPGGPDDSPERTAKVQVKTTSQQSAEAGTAAVLLKNWRRMATERSPWFVLHLTLVGSDVRDAFLVHIDEARVAAALQRIREVEQGLRAERTMSLTTLASERLAQPWSGSLRAALLRHVGPSEDDYSAEKARWVKNAGFTAHRHGISVEVAAGEDADPLAMMADWIVGLLPELPVRALRVVERRFEIDKIVKDLRDIEGRLKVEAIPPVTTATITITSADHSERVVLETELRIARRYIPWLPPEYERMHFAGKGISFISEPARTLRAQFLLPGEGVQSRLSDLVRVGKALRLLAANDDPAPEVRFESPGNLGFQSPIRGDLVLDRVALRFIRVMECAAVVARHYEIDPNIVVDPGDLMDDALQVVTLAAGLDRTMNGLDSMSVPCDDAAVHGCDVVVLTAPAFMLASDLVCGVIGFVGRAERSATQPGWMTLTAPSIRCFSRLIGREEEWSQTIRARLGEAIDRLVSEGITGDRIFRPKVEGDVEPPER